MRAGALEARGIPAESNLETDVEARIEGEEKLMLIKAVQLRYRLKVPREKRAEADRTLEIHEDCRPVRPSIRRGFEVRGSAEIEETG